MSDKSGDTASTGAVAKRYAYFPGCSANSTGISFTKSAEFVAKKMGIELVEIPDWCCCGTSAALVTDSKLAVALPARSLAIAEKMDPTLDVATGCAGCFNSLKSARHFAVQSEENRHHVEDLIDMPYKASADVFSFLEIMSRPDSQEILKEKMTNSLHGLKVACYYGCALVRPAKVCQFDDLENPQSMDQLVKLAGGEPIEWGFKVECCGGSHNISDPKAAKKLTESIYEDAIINGAEAIAVACPLCFLNLDMREKELNAIRAKNGKSQFDIPTFYFTELLGLAMGGKPNKLGINLHFWPAKKVVTAALNMKPASEEADLPEAKSKAKKPMAPPKSAAPSKPSAPTTPTAPDVPVLVVETLKAKPDSTLTEEVSK